MRSGVCLMYAFNQRVSPDGRKRVDLVDRYGSLMRNAYVMSGAGMPINVPVEKELSVTEYTKYPTVVVGFMGGDSTPIVLGALDIPDVTYTNERDTDTKYVEQSDGTRVMSNDADTDVATNISGMEDVMLAAPQGGRVIIKHDGRVAIAGNSISMQVGANSYMRISRDGDTAGRLPLVDPLADVLDSLGSKINDLQAELAELKGTLAGTFSIELDGLAVNPSSGAVTAISPLFPLTTARILDVIETTNEAIQPLDRSTIASATLRVGSDTEAG